MVGDVDEFALRVEHGRERIAGTDGNGVRGEGSNHAERAVLRVTHHIESIAETHSKDLDWSARIVIGLMGRIRVRKVGPVAVERRVVQKRHSLSGGIVHQVAPHREVQANALQDVPARDSIGGNHRLSLPAQEKLGIAGIEARIERGEGRSHRSGTSGPELEGVHPFVHGRAQLCLKFARERPKRQRRDPCDGHAIAPSAAQSTRCSQTHDCLNHRGMPLARKSGIRPESDSLERPPWMIDCAAGNWKWWRAAEIASTSSALPTSGTVFLSRRSFPTEGEARSAGRRP